MPAERLSYDANGNILTYHRNMQNAAAMDQLKYNYYGGTNKLEYVYDSVAGKPSGNDLASQNAGNYVYDAIGNLIQDNSEGISNIDWTVYGKINSITKNGATTNYIYDASGNRIAKIPPSGGGGAPGM